MLDDGVDINFSCGKVWNIKVPPIVYSFLWMLAIDRIPSKEFHWGVNIQNSSISCPWCDGKLESASNRFFKCIFIEGLWAKIFNWWKVVWKQVDGFVDFFALCNNMKMAKIRKSLWLISIAAACWTLWLARNGLVFDGRRVHKENLVFQSKMKALLWIRSAHDEIMLEENFWWISPQSCQVVSYKSKPATSFCVIDREFGSNWKSVSEIVVRDLRR